MVNHPPKKPPLASHLTDAQWRRRAARIRYEIETAFREEGLGDPALLYDEEKDFFRFADGVFAFSSEHANWGSSGGGGGYTSNPATEEYARRGPSSCPYSRTSWKGNSQNFACREFSEVEAAL